VIRKIPLFFTSFFSVLALQSFCQIGWDSTAIQSKNRLFLGITYNLLPGIEKGPANIYPNYVTDNLINGPYPQQGYSAVFLFNTDFAAIGGKIRYNLVQFSNRTSISLSTSPSFGVGLTVVDEQDIHQITPYADASYNIPLFIEFNYGCGATRNSFDRYGLFAFGGIEYSGLLLQNSMSNGAWMDANGNFYTADFINHWAEPAFGFGVRYRNKKNVQREVFLKYGFGPPELYISPYEEVESAHAWTLKLTFARDF
jgi:hypothetical protein